MNTSDIVVYARALDYVESVKVKHVLQLHLYNSGWLNHPC